MAEAKIQWTEDQRQAIEAPRQNLLISAAAGSGKTAVLTERIFRLLTDPRDPIALSEIVAITFTRAAAASLREKLAERLTRAQAQSPGDRRIQRLLLELPQANISTVHAFCLRIIRENAALLGLRSRLCIASDAQKDRLQKDCMREALNRFFSSAKAADQKQSETLSSVYYLFTQGRSSDPVLLPLQLYDQLRALEESVQKLTDLSRESRRVLESLKAGENRYFSEGAGQLAHQQLLSTFSALKGKLSAYLAFFPADEQADESLLPHAHAAMNTVEVCLNLLRQKDFDAFCRALSNYEPLTYKNKSKTVPTASDEGKLIKNFYDTKIKRPLEEARREFCKDRALLLQEEEARLCTQEFIAELLQCFDSIYSAKKRERGILDYADLEHLGLEALRKSKVSYCRALFVDEYQDTNRLQDVFFRECVKGGGFFFFVGDVKQSIYRFRNAAPELFLSYKNDFPSLMEVSEKRSLGKSLFFSENFRSDTTVIDFANDVFSTLMNDNRRKKDRMYSKKDALRHRKTGGEKLPVEYYLFEQADNAASPAAQRRDETALITERVLKLLGEEGRRPEEIAVIAYTNPFLSKVRAAFLKAGVPVSQGNAGLMQTLESEELTALIGVLENPLNDIALAALCTSPLFSFSSEELETIRAYAPGALYHALWEAGEESNLSPVQKKARALLDFLDTWRAKARRMKVSDFLLHLYRGGGVLAAFSQNRKSRRENLMKLYREAVSFEADGRHTLSEFLTYLSDRKNQTFQSESDAQIQPGYVTLMTVHKSKGLEFPICIFAQLGREEKRESGLFLDPALGIFHHRYDPLGHAFYPTLSEGVVRRKYREEGREESKRLLYVGITRASEKLILIDGKKTDVQKRFSDCGLFPYLKKDSIHSHELSTPSAMLLYSLRHDRALQRFAASYRAQAETPQSVACRTFILTVIPELGCETRSAIAAEFTPETPCFEPEMLREVEDALVSEKKRKNASLLPSKLSVSEILHLGAPRTEEAQATHLSFSRGEIRGAEIGTAMHAFMQFCDFERAKEDPAAEAERLCARAFLREEQAKSLNFYALSRFFRSPAFEKIQKSPRVKRELRFNVFLKADQILPEAQEGEVLVQGVIDCFYEKEDGSYAILDFKTDAVSPETGEAVLRARHTKQLQIYRKALEEMSGKTVSSLSLYSFALAREIPIPLTDRP